jgi:hypothetical protein
LIEKTEREITKKIEKAITHTHREWLK